VIRYRSRRARRKEAADLNVTAFMNLMVVLVPFLLMMAVFSRVAIHELDLPGQASAEKEPARLELEVVLRADRMILVDRNRGPLHVIDNVNGGYDLETLSAHLLDLKNETPDVDRATLLLERQVDYQSLISVMDAMRAQVRQHNGTRSRIELFPHVSIGDAPSEGGPPA
jgi:biopolymer transport protein ExbD